MYKTRSSVRFNVRMNKKGHLITQKSAWTYLYRTFCADADIRAHEHRQTLIYAHINTYTHFKINCISMSVCIYFVLYKSTNEDKYIHIIFYLNICVTPHSSIRILASNKNDGLLIDLTFYKKNIHIERNSQTNHAPRKWKHCSWAEYHQPSRA